MTIDRDAVTVLIPTLNEAPTIQGLVREFAERGYRRVLVVDGGSDDGTAALAEEAGATVMPQTGRGKGNAVIEAFRVVETPFVLMLDGDGTYSAVDADRMVEPLASGYDQVIGDRLVDVGRGAFSRLNYTGNWLLNRLFRLAHGRYLSDILSGYRAFTADAIRAMQLKEEGFGIETEIAVESVRNNHRVGVVPVQYGRRSGTATKLNPLRDGYRIAVTIYRLARMNNPLFYFGLIGAGFVVAGFLLGVVVVIDWLSGIERLPLTILTVLLITVGIQIVSFGMIGDLLLSFHRETLDELAHLRRELEERK
ncbi:MAG: S-layer glycoprotein N-glycosyltransferase AglJ [Methanospirillum sp.]|nr:S-layer glycoprotein N-glycosyltransferase AglJ [Methanospirillum sp.]